MIHFLIRHVLFPLIVLRSTWLYGCSGCRHGHARSGGGTSHLIEERFTPCEIASSYSSPLSSCRSISPVNQPACLWFGCRPRCGDLRVKLTPRAPSGSQKRGRSTAHPLSTRFFKQTLFFGCVTHGLAGPPLEGENRGAEHPDGGCLIIS